MAHFLKKTLVSANSKQVSNLQSFDENNKLLGQRQVLNLLCPKRVLFYTKRANGIHVFI